MRMLRHEVRNQEAPVNRSRPAIGWLCRPQTALCLPGLLALLPALAAAAAGQTLPARNQPLDFGYRVQGSAVPVGIVFDDGRSVFIQPADAAQVPKLRVEGLPFAVQGPYLVVHGLANRLSLALDDNGGRATTIEYTGAPRPETVARDCAASTPGNQARVLLPFVTGALRTEPGGLDRWPKLLAQARGADRVTIVAFADRPQSPLAQRRTQRVHELLVAAGVPAAAIEQRVQPPAASSVEVISTRHPVPACESPVLAARVVASMIKSPGASVLAAAGRDAALRPAVAAPLAQQTVPAPQGAAPSGTDVPRPGMPPERAGPSTAQPAADSARDADAADAAGSVNAVDATHAAHATRAADAAHAAQASGASPVEAATARLAGPSPAADPAPSLQLQFLPNTTVQATLRRYLRAHGFEVEFKSMPTLLVEEFAEVRGLDLRDVLRRALGRLGLRGEIQGNRLLVVEFAN